MDRIVVTDTAPGWGLRQRQRVVNANPYIVDGEHLGHCNACGGEEALGSPCMDCPDGEIVPYADDPDPDA